MELPGWNNPAAVQSAHSLLEGGALLFFAALVVFDVWAHIDKKRERWLEPLGLICFAIAVVAEIAAYPYGKRNDELSNKTIASLMGRASQADERTGKLSVDLETEKTASRNAQTRLTNAQLRLMDELSAARDRQSVLTNEQIALTQASAQASRDLEAERKKRLLLAASLRDREACDQSGIFAQLDELPLPNLIFEFPSEREPRRMAEQIYAFWNQPPPAVRRRVDDDSIRPGIRMSAGWMRPDVSKLSATEYFAASRIFEKMKSDADSVIDLFVSALTRCGVEASHDGDSNLPLGSILIEVGEKPNHELEDALNELGPIRPTETRIVTPNGAVINMTMGTNRRPIPDEPIAVPNSKK
jgi:hypothetical protein